jgi:hypothetical protein
VKHGLAWRSDGLLPFSIFSEDQSGCKRMVISPK